MHVHHLKYKGNPWDIENKFLTTLCDECHEFEHKERKKYENALLEIFEQYPAIQLSEIILSLYEIKQYSKAPVYVVFNIFSDLIKTKNFEDDLFNLIKKHIRNKK